MGKRVREKFYEIYLRVESRVKKIVTDYLLALICISVRDSKVSNGIISTHSQVSAQ
jgi:hypothetical protein